MRVTQRVKKLLSSYETDNPGTKSALARILMEGKMAGTGRALILPIDHAFSKELVPKFSGADFEYHFQLAVDAGLSAITAPLGMLEMAADSYAGAVPMILQMHAGDPFNDAKSSISGSIRSALRLGCIGISCAIDSDEGEYSEIATLLEEARAHGLAVMIWASTRAKSGETDTSLEAISRIADKAIDMGAHLICVRVPGAAKSPLSDSIRHIVRAGKTRRMLVFASSFMQDNVELFEEIRGVRDGGAQGYVLPSNSLYRPFDEALSLVDRSLNIYQGKA